MVARLVEPADDPGFVSSVEGGAGDHLLEQVLAHQPRAREREQQPARLEQMERLQVQVLVGTRRPVDLVGTVASFGGSQITMP